MKQRRKTSARVSILFPVMKVCPVKAAKLGRPIFKINLRLRILISVSFFKRPLRGIEPVVIDQINLDLISSDSDEDSIKKR